MYAPPQGWIEVLSNAVDEAKRSRFHTDEHCPRIKRPDTLVQAARPGVASLCPECAPP